MKAILLICLLAVAVTADQIKTKRNIMNVFAQVENTIKNGGPLDIVANVLGEFQNDATAEQAAHDALRARANVECSGEFEYRTRQVAEASSVLKQGKLSLDGCVDQQNRAVADLAFTKKVLAESKVLIEVSTRGREQEVIAYGEYEEAYNFNAAQMEECIEIVQSVISGEASMIQLVRHTHKIIKNSFKLGATEKFAELMSVLSQLSSQDSYEEFLEQLSNVVARVAQEIEDHWQETQELELKHQAEFEEMIATTTQNIETLTVTQAELETLLANLSRCIVEQTGIVYSATAKRDQHQRLWDEAAAYCATGEELYVNSTQERRDELDLLDTLRAKVAERWGDFEDIERERVQKQRAAKN